MWNRLRTYLKKAGYLNEYLTVPEWQKDGTCHLHVGTDSVVPWRVLSESWARLGGGFVWTSHKRTMRNPEDVARELAKYLTKSAAHPEHWQTAYRCKLGGGYRRVPWHRYWPSRPVGRAIRRNLQATETEDAVRPPQEDAWELVRFIEGVDTRDLPPFKAVQVSVVEGCPTHLEEETECCHGVPGLHRCICGGPAAWLALLEEYALDKPPPDPPFVQPMRGISSSSLDNRAAADPLSAFGGYSSRHGGTPELARADLESARPSEGRRAEGVGENVP